jgi:CubicO group peptidase (beta-lactamase class C family)
MGQMRGLKITAAVVIIFFTLLGLFLLWAVFTYNVEYVSRLLRWGRSDVNTYLIDLPQRPLQPAPTPYYFEDAPDEERVAALFESILEVDDFETFLEESDTLAFLVIQDDRLLYEHYFNGAQRDSLMTSFSVAKSFTSALIGAAIAQGTINSVDDAITDYLPELAERDARFEDITIRHLLMMASGLDYQEMRAGLFNGDDPLTTYYPDQRQITLENTRIIDPPGAYFRYNKYHPQLLGMILERTTGRSVVDFMQESLWDSVGMEFSGSWNLDSEESGFEKMEAGVNARAVDFAKLGRLYLEEGRWDGVQVLPAEWIAESTGIDTAVHNEAYYRDEFGQTIFSNGQGYYKYMWYGLLRDGEAYDFAAEGDHGQIIYVSPQANLIIVRLGTEYGIEMFEWLDAFYQFAGQAE